MNEMCFYCFSPIEGAEVCPNCGRKIEDGKGDGRQIKPGTPLRERYLIGHTLSEDPIGVTYYGYDTQQEKKVWIREYLPEGLVNRQDGDPSIRFLLAEAKEFFERGKELYMRRAKEMAQFNANPGIAKMNCYLEENGTGYVVMDRSDGKSLSEYVREHGGKLAWFETLQIMSPVMNLLQKMHGTGVVHGYVSPENIFVNGNGQGLLLNFNILDEKRTLAPGNVAYLPQGLFDGKKQVGPWVDVYAAAATIYHMVTGTPPASTTDYLTGETQVAPPSQKGGTVPPKAEEVLTQVLKREDVSGAKNMEAFERGLLGIGVSAPRRAGGQTVQKRERAPRPGRERSGSAKKWIWLGPVLGVAAAILVLLTLTCVRYFGAEKLYHDGMDALAESRTSEAISCFRAAMDKFPWGNGKYADIYHETRGKDFYQQAGKALEWGSYEQALNLYEQALKEDPQNEDYAEGKRAAEKFKEGYLLYGEGQFAKAKESFKSALAYDPANSYISSLIAGIDAWLAGRDAFYQDEYEDAYNAFSRALEYDEENAHYMQWCDDANNKWQAQKLYNDAYYYLSIEEYILAYEAIAEAAELDPELADYEEGLELFFELAKMQYYYEELAYNEYTDYDYLSISKITVGPDHLQSVSTLPAYWDCMCIYVEPQRKLEIHTELYLIDDLSEDERIYLGGGDDTLKLNYGLWIFWNTSDGEGYSPGNYCIEVTLAGTDTVIAREYFRIMLEEE